MDSPDHPYSPLRDRKLLTASVDAVVTIIIAVVTFTVADPETVKLVALILATLQVPIGLLIAGMGYEDGQIVASEGKAALPHFK
jgi:hypothetical protein